MSNEKRKRKKRYKKEIICKIDERDASGDAEGESSAEDESWDADNESVCSYRLHMHEQ
jgi:hypothetical protein